LKRAELGRRIFSDQPARILLESILHPRIRESWGRQVAAWRQEGRSGAAVVIPLLFETDAAPLFDAVICVACSLPSQSERLRARGWSDDEITRRNQAQIPIDRKIALSQYVIWTEPDMEIHRAQLRKVLGHELRERGAGSQ
jgi:dephospho-CoA kinase